MSRRLSSLLIALAVALLATMSWARTSGAPVDAALRITQAAVATPGAEPAAPPALAVVDVDDDDDDDDGVGHDGLDESAFGRTSDGATRLARALRLGRGRSRTAPDATWMSARSARGPPRETV